MTVKEIISLYNVSPYFATNLDNIACCAVNRGNNFSVCAVDERSRSPVQVNSAPIDVTPKEKRVVELPAC